MSKLQKKINYTIKCLKLFGQINFNSSKRLNIFAVKKSENFLFNRTLNGSVLNILKSSDRCAHKATLKI